MSTWRRSCSWGSQSHSQCQCHAHARPCGCFCSLLPPPRAQQLQLQLQLRPLQRLPQSRETLQLGPPQIQIVQGGGWRGGEGGRRGGGWRRAQKQQEHFLHLYPSKRPTPKVRKETSIHHIAYTISHAFACLYIYKYKSYETSRTTSFTFHSYIHGTNKIKSL